MKILLPENIEDITLKQYQKNHKLTEMFENGELTEQQYNYKVIELFSGIPYSKVSKVAYKDLKEVLVQIELALNTDVEFKSRFTLNGVEFGFIPNLDEIDSSEFVDLSKYGTDVETLHNLIAVLFRPITNTDSFGNYEIEAYNGTKKYADIMKSTPMNIVNGCLGFFYHLAKDLRTHIQKCIAEEQARGKKHQATTKNGVGMQQSMS